MKVTFRPATLHDAERITYIYNQAVRNKCCCDTETVTVLERMPWIRSHIGKEHYPLYVGEVSDPLGESYPEVIGYGYLTEYRFGRPAVSGTAEVSYFLDFKYHRMGLGTKFLSFLEDEARRLGFDTLIAILMSSNDASIGLLRKSGYELWGSMPDCVRIGDLITDHIYYGKKISG